MDAKNDRKNVGGRPRKFHEASRPITVTLPERTLNCLQSIDKDRAKAIVKVADAVCSGNRPSVEVVEFDKDAGYVLVGPNKVLKQITWLKLLEIAPSRYLLSLPPGTSIDSLEVALVDLIEHLCPEDEDDRELLLRLRDIFRDQRRARSVSKAEILFVKTRNK